MDRISAREQARPSEPSTNILRARRKLFQELIRRHWSKFAASLNVTYQKDRDIRDQLAALGHAEGTIAHLAQK